MSSPAPRQVLYEKVAEKIQSQIEDGTFQPGERLPSIKALCQSHQVSNITIRAALKQLVTKGYLESRPRSGVFIRERSNRTPRLRGEKVIGLLVTAMDTQFFMDIIRGVEGGCQKAGYRVLIANSKNEAELEARHLRDFSREVSGLVIAPVTGKGNYAAYSVLLQKEVPFVFVDRYVMRLSAPLVATDNEAGGFLAAKHLLKEAGRDKVFVLCGRSATSIEERLRGYRAALDQAGIAFDPERVRCSSLEHDAAGYVLTQEIVEKFPGVVPFGIFAMNEYMALGAYAALREASLKIPQDVAVVSFDDALAPFLDPPLTTVRQNPHAMGKSAVEVLLDVIRYGSAHSAPSVRLKPELVIRNSTGAPSRFSLSEHVLSITQVG